MPPSLTHSLAHSLTLFFEQGLGFLRARISRWFLVRVTRLDTSSFLDAHCSTLCWTSALFLLTRPRAPSSHNRWRTRTCRQARAMNVGFIADDLESSAPQRRTRPASNELSSLVLPPPTSNTLWRNAPPNLEDIGVMNNVTLPPLPAGSTLANNDSNRFRALSYFQNGNPVVENTVGIEPPPRRSDMNPTSAPSLSHHDAETRANPFLSRSNADEPEPPRVNPFLGRQGIDRENEPQPPPPRANPIVNRQNNRREDDADPPPRVNSFLTRQNDAREREAEPPPPRVNPFLRPSEANGNDSQQRNQRGDLTDDSPIINIDFQREPALRRGSGFDISSLNNPQPTVIPPPRRSRRLPTVSSARPTGQLRNNLNEVLAMFADMPPTTTFTATTNAANNDNTLPALAGLNSNRGNDRGGNVELADEGPGRNGGRNTGISVESTPLLPPPPLLGRKRKRPTNAEAVVNEEEAKKTDVTAGAIENDENCCSICFEPWTSSGKHQLSCLPCGHLFGRSCIDTWLRRKPACPNCKINMRKKKATLIFGAPTKLAVVDEGEVAALKEELEKERNDHERTKKRMREYRDHATSLKNRLKVHATPMFGGPATATNGPHQSLLALSNAARASTTATTGARAGAVDSFLRRVIREQPIQDTSEVLVQPTSFSLQPTSFNRNRNVRRLNIPSMANLFQDAAPSGFPNVSMLFNVDTNGGSKALAFDESGNVVFGEKRQMRLGDMAPQKVTRRPLLHHQVRVQSRADILGRINHLAVSRSEDSPFRGYIAVASQSKRLHVLSQSLDEVLHYPTQAVPLSTWWSTTQPNLLVTGLMNGMVCAFDLRNTVAPIASKKVSASGNVAVHSLVEVTVDGSTSPVVLAGTPAKIVAITFGGFAGTMTMEEVYRRGVGAGELCCSLAVDGGRVLVSSRQSQVDAPGGIGRHVVYEGVKVGMRQSGSSAGTALEFGFALGNESGLTGHRMTTLYEGAGLLSGSGVDGEGTVVMSPDSGSVGMNKFTRAWEYRGGAWSTAHVGSYQSRLSPMVVKTMPLARDHAGIGRGVAAHLGDATLQVFSVAGR